MVIKMGPRYVEFNEDTSGPFIEVYKRGQSGDMLYFKKHGDSLYLDTNELTSDTFDMVSGRIINYEEPNVSIDGVDYVKLVPVSPWMKLMFASVFNEESVLTTEKVINNSHFNIVYGEVDGCMLVAVMDYKGEIDTEVVYRKDNEFEVTSSKSVDTPSGAEVVKAMGINYDGKQFVLK